MPPNNIVSENEQKMQKAVNFLADELKSVRTGRASTGLVENLSNRAALSTSERVEISWATRCLNQLRQTRTITRKNSISFLFIITFL